MKAIAMIIIGVSCFSAPVRANIQALILKLSSSTTQRYTVPTGKVFIVEHVLSSVGPAKFRLNAGTPPNAFAYVQFPGSNGVYTLPHPMKVPQSFEFAFVSGEEVIIFGSLVSTQDLYAAIESKFENTQAVAGQFIGDLRLGSSRPAAIVFESSTTLTNWSEQNGVALQPTSDKTRTQFSVPIGPSPNAFYRASVRGR